MNKSVMKKWVKALRSGKYKKKKGYLKFVEYVWDSKKKDDKEVVKGFCCLGVACEIGVAQARDKYFLLNDSLPQKVQDKLSGMNDSGRYSFKRIAAYIEKNYKTFTEDFGND